MSIIRRLTCICFSLAIPLVAMAVGQPSNSAASQPKNETSPLIDKVRAATARFKDINVALHEGWTVATPCVSGPDTGAMGVHLVMGSRLADGIIRADESVRRTATTCRRSGSCMSGRGRTIRKATLPIGIRTSPANNRPSSELKLTFG